VDGDGGMGDASSTLVVGDIGLQPLMICSTTRAPTPFSSNNITTVVVATDCTNKRLS